jgi:hypothetical protein
MVTEVMDHILVYKAILSLDRCQKGFFYVIDPLAIGRRASLRGQTRNEDVFFTNTTPTNLIEHGLFAKYEISVVDFFFCLLIKDFTRTNPSDLNQLLRPRNDYYNLIQPDLNGVCIKSLILINQKKKNNFLTIFS